MSCIFRTLINTPICPPDQAGSSDSSSRVSKTSSLHLDSQGTVPPKGLQWNEYSVGFIKLHQNHRKHSKTFYSVLHILSTSSWPSCVKIVVVTLQPWKTMIRLGSQECRCYCCLSQCFGLALFFIAKHFQCFRMGSMGPVQTVSNVIQT